MSATEPLPDSGAPGASAPPPPAPAPAAEPRPNGRERSPKFTVTDRDSAAKALNGLLFNADGDKAGAAPERGDPGPERSAGAEASDDTGADESPPTGDATDDEGQGEQSQTATAIEPPASWPADDKAAFSSLPPALQATIAKRESEREAVITRRSQEAAENRKAAEAERSGAAALRSEYLESLQKMLLLSAPEAAALQNVDMVALQRDNPHEFTRVLAMREGLSNRLSAIGNEWNAQIARNEAAQHQALAQALTVEQQQLREKWPDFANEAKAAPLRQELGTYLRDKGGFTNDEISRSYDHRLVVLATKAMLYDRQQNALSSANGKRDNPPAQVQRPGTSQGRDSGPGAKLKNTVNRFGRTNSARDAGSLISEILS